MVKRPMNALTIQDMCGPLSVCVFKDTATKVPVQHTETASCKSASRYLRFGFLL